MSYTGFSPLAIHHSPGAKPPHAMSLSASPSSFRNRFKPFLSRVRIARVERLRFTHRPASGTHTRLRCMFACRMRRLFFCECDTAFPKSGPFPVMAAFPRQNYLVSRYVTCRLTTGSNFFSSIRSGVFLRFFVVVYTCGLSVLRSFTMIRAPLFVAMFSFLEFLTRPQLPARSAPFLHPPPFLPRPYFQTQQSA